MMGNFFAALDVLVAGGEMVVDWPTGAAHPRFLHGGHR